MIRTWRIIKWNEIYYLMPIHSSNIYSSYLMNWMYLPLFSTRILLCTSIGSSSYGYMFSWLFVWEMWTLHLWKKYCRMTLLFKGWRYYFHTINILEIQSGFTVTDAMNEVIGTRYDTMMMIITWRILKGNGICYLVPIH